MPGGRSLLQLMDGGDRPSGLTASTPLLFGGADTTTAEGINWRPATYIIGIALLLVLGLALTLMACWLRRLDRRNRAAEAAAAEVARQRELELQKAEAEAQEERPIQVVIMQPDDSVILGEAQEQSALEEGQQQQQQQKRQPGEGKGPPAEQIARGDSAWE